MHQVVEIDFFRRGAAAADQRKTSEPGGQSEPLDYRLRIAGDLHHRIAAASGSQGHDFFFQFRIIRGKCRVRTGFQRDFPAGFDEIHPDHGETSGKAGGLDRELPQQPQPHHHQRFAEFGPAAAYALESHAADHAENGFFRGQIVIFDPDQIGFRHDQIIPVVAVVTQTTVAFVERGHGTAGFQHLGDCTVSQRFGEMHSRRIHSADTGEFGPGRNQSAVRLQQNLIRGQRTDIDVHFAELRFPFRNKVDGFDFHIRSFQLAASGCRRLTSGNATGAWASADW